MLSRLHDFSKENKKVISGLLAVLLATSGGLSVGLLSALEINDETVKNKLIASAVLAGVSVLAILLHLYLKDNALLGALALVSAIASFALQFNIKDDLDLTDAQSSQFWASYWIGVGSSVVLLTFLVGLHSSSSSPAEAEGQQLKESTEKLTGLLDKLKSKLPEFKKPELPERPAFERPAFGKVYAPSEASGSEASGSEASESQ